jgi:tetratricopeptide (TPR) repeat protein
VVLLASALLTVLLLGCAEYQALDQGGLLVDEFEKRVDQEVLPDLQVPFELDEAIREEMRGRVPLAASDARKRDAILDFIFGHVGLEYSLQPTRDAAGTFKAKQGNCLSFVNLFVGIAREVRLDPFYVEVQDYKRWNYQDGLVVSRGHIVAGMRVDGSLATFDFLPYQAKSYRDFKPISDLAAAAHFYNNLGAEAVMAGDLDQANRWLDVATSLAPDFDKAINNRGVVLRRLGRMEEAKTVLERGLDLYPENVPLLSNLARVAQEQGDNGMATQLLDRLEALNEASPFFYIYRGDVALANGDTAIALDYMRRAFRSDTELPEVHTGLVRVYLALGKLKEAQHHVERALKLDATNEEARKYAAMLTAGN